ncbi:DUF3857 domain-containing protein [Pedobacter metabolipauper]|uniref:Transglutaminase superfamily protein n=1 Tax=Pedobacter metabolipauper TaxID=425513 RepID=A0A4R6SZG2_9SPHI|nr:DUF3857 domain-containing protein [Pedobacter metabolipauper]TDQ11467.1 transglutaminase superfamily protein [Pedobacter metabolipauper]
MLLQSLFKLIDRSKELRLTIIFISLSIISGYGQGKNFSINRNAPSWIVNKSIKGARPADKNISDGYFLSVFENQNHVELAQDYTHIIREIVSDAGVQNGSQISVTYDPSFQKLVFHKITLWRNNIPSDQLQQGKFKILQNEKDLSKFIYSGTYDAFLLLEDVRKGDKIEYSYTVIGTNPIYGKKYASLFHFEGSSSIGHLYMNLITSKKRSLRFLNFNFDRKPKETEHGDQKIYEWEEKLTKTHRIVDFEPSWYNPIRKTQITEYQSWNEVVKWGLAVNDYPNLKTPLLDKKVTELKAQAANNEKKYMELAIRFVQDEIRYMGIEMGAYSHRPNSPEQILKQRYGDCKDKSLLLVMLLKAQNIPAYMAYADTYTTIKTKDYLPSPFIFNHVIVAIDRGNYKTWIDPTTSYQRGSVDDLYIPNYGYALVLKDGVNALEEVAVVPEGKVVSNLTFNIADTLADKKSALTIHTVYTRNYADNIRSEIAESGSDGIEKDYLEYYGKYYPDIEVKNPIKIVDDEEKNTVEITESYEITNIWVDNDAGDDKQFYIYGDMVSSELRNITAKNRLAPMSLKYPVSVEQIITVNMPYDANFGKESVKVETDDYYFELYQFHRGRTVTFNYTFRNLKPFIEGSQTKAYVKNNKKIKEYLSYTLSRSAGISDDFDQVSTNSNPYTLTAALFLIIIFVFFFLKVYQKSESMDIEKIAAARPIGGWLIVLGIFVTIFPLIIFIEPGSIGLYSINVWNKLSAKGNALGYMAKTLYVIYLITFAFLFNYAIVCLIQFYNRRESFPKHYSVFLIFYLFFSILTVGIDEVFLNKINDKPVNYWTLILTILFSIAFTMIWIQYLKKSVRVKGTFVFTYPEREYHIALMKHYNANFAANANVPPANRVPYYKKEENNNENV